jgi:transglutaminase-like putative cysteine protease
VKRETGAHRVVAFDHNLRSSGRREDRESLQREPVRYAHNDYTERSGPQRVRELFPAEADELLSRRFAVINVWKPLTPVEEAPLAVCDAQTIAPGDFVPTDLLYPDRSGEVYSMRYGATHRWFYFPRMQPDEAMLLKCYDSARDRARFTAHSAFDDPTSPANPRSRESIEVRTLAFY